MAGSPVTWTFCDKYIMKWMDNFILFSPSSMDLLSWATIQDGINEFTTLSSCKKGESFTHSQMWRSIIFILHDRTNLFYICKILLYCRNLEIQVIVRPAYSKVCRRWFQLLKSQYISSIIMKKGGNCPFSTLLSPFTTTEKWGIVVTYIEVRN